MSVRNYNYVILVKRHPERSRGMYCENSCFDFAQYDYMCI